MVPFAAPFLTAWAREGARLVIAVDRVKFQEGRKEPDRWAACSFARPVAGESLQKL